MSKQEQSRNSPSAKHVLSSPLGAYDKRPKGASHLSLGGMGTAMALATAKSYDLVNVANDYEPQKLRHLSSHVL